MNELLLALDLESWKPWVTALALPPIPLLLLLLVGARLMPRRRVLSWLLILLGILGLWFSATLVLGTTLVRVLTTPPPALTERAVSELRKAPRTAIVVLGGGRRGLAPEYGLSSLNERSLERLRYGIWLARSTQLPLLFSGGSGQGAGPPEAEIASRVAEQEFGLKLRWAEDQSRDTRQNARASVAMLQAAGIAQVVLVTHDYHMTRARGHFERELAPHGMTLVLAPMGLPAHGGFVAMDWMPGERGFGLARLALREWLARAVGA